MMASEEGYSLQPNTARAGARELSIQELLYVAALCCLPFCPQAAGPNGLDPRPDRGCKNATSADGTAPWPLRTWRSASPATAPPCRHAAQFPSRYCFRKTFHVLAYQGVEETRHLTLGATARSHELTTHGEYVR